VPLRCVAPQALCVTLACDDAVADFITYCTGAG